MLSIYWKFSANLIVWYNYLSINKFTRIINAELDKIVYISSTWDEICKKVDKNKDSKKQDILGTNWNHLHQSLIIKAMIKQAHVIFKIDKFCK